MAPSQNLAAHIPEPSPLIGQRRRGAPRWFALASFLVLTVFIATGCLTGDVTVKVDKNGSGSIDVVVLPFDELQSALVEAKAIPVVQEAVEGYDDATFETTTVDGKLAYRAHIPFDDYRDLADVLSEGFDVAGSEVRLFSDFQLTKVDDTWRLNATLAPDLLADAFRADPSIQQLIDSAGLVALNSDLRLTVSLPGRVTRTNGERTASGTAQWSLKKGESATFMMVTEPKPLLTDTQKIFIGAGLAIILGVVFIVWGSRTEWKGSGERKERKRAKKLTFGAGREGGRGDGWTDPGPVAPASAETMPTSGAMPPRAIPTLHDSTVNAQGTEILAPPISKLAPVAPPVAPDVDPTLPDPFAPHVPGESFTGQPVEGSRATPREFTPVAPPTAPIVDPNVPNPFAPHVPGQPLEGAAQFDAVPDAAPPADGPTAPQGPETRATPITPVPTEPAPLEHPGFVFDGKPGWFSLDPEVEEGASHGEPETGDGGAGEGASGEGSVDDATDVDQPAPTFAPDDGVPEPEASADGHGEPDIGPSDDSAEHVATERKLTGGEGGIPAAWYPDPDDPNRYRWWDGGDWTDYVSGEDS